MKKEYITLLVFVAFVWYEWIYEPSQTTVASVPNNPANANALGTPSAGIAPSTLSPMQLGSGLFENQSGLQTSPGATDSE